MKNTPKLQARRSMPKMRRKNLNVPAVTQLTLGDLVAAACDALGDAQTVARVLSSNRMARYVGRKIVIG